MRQVVGWLSVLLLFGGSVAGWWLQRGDAQAAVPDEKAFIYAEYHLGLAAEKLEQMGSILGSYDGIPSDLIVGMEIPLAWGDRYCVQLMRDGNWYHRAGPGGTALRGACPV